MSGLRFEGINPLFFTPLATFRVEGAAQLNPLLLAEAQAMRQRSPGIRRSNRGGWHSEDDFFQRKEPGCVALRAHIIEAVRVCSMKLAPELDIERFAMQAEGWFNVLDAHGFNSPHDHPAWLWSGCYYVRVPQADAREGGAIEFLDSRTNIRTLTIEEAPCFAIKHTVVPEEGMLLLFPSWLRHWVAPNPSAQERVSVAFNARLIAPR
jgi:uncharacterized protein (TIGR02466 family)